MKLRALKFNGFEIRREHGRYFVYDGDRFLHSHDTLAQATGALTC